MMFIPPTRPVKEIIIPPMDDNSSQRSRVVIPLPVEPIFIRPPDDNSKSEALIALKTYLDNLKHGNVQGITVREFLSRFGDPPCLS